MKKYTSVVLMFIMIFLLIACNKKEEINKIDNDYKNLSKIKIVATIFPEYDWIREIIKGKEDKFDISILMDSGIDLHNFQPTMQDMLDVKNADLFVYVGGESDKWVEKVLEESSDDKILTMNLMDVIKDRIKVEEQIEGMEEDSEHTEGENIEDSEEEEIEYDEHIWLSLENAKIICKKLCDTISNMDKENESIYINNLSNYIKKIDDLNKEYVDVINNSKIKTLLFGDRFPFRYMVDDYGLKYYAAFKGCSAETEASFNTIRFLADKLGEENIKYVLKIDGSDGKIAEAIIQNSKEKNATIETMYSIQAVSADEINSGNTYISYMRDNLNVLNKVLN